MATRTRRPGRSNERKDGPAAKRRPKRGNGTRSERAVALIVLLQRESGPIPLSRFDEDVWGERQRFLAMADVLNDTWLRERGTPLFEYLDAEQRPTTNPVAANRKYFRRVDFDPSGSVVQNVAMLAAVMRFTSVLGDTPFGEGAEAVLDQMSRKLAKDAVRHLHRIDRKYHVVVKGPKSYTQQAETLEEINAALLYEKSLTIEWPQANGATITFKVQPLTLVMFNGGLYLLACPYPSPARPERPRRYRVEKIVSAKCNRHETCEYPIEYDPAEYFRGGFGLYGDGGTLQTVTIEILDDGIEEYLTARRWGEQQTYDRERRILTFKATDLTEVAAWVVGFGPRMRVLGPSQLRQDVLAMGEGILDVYRASR
jgi:predicted DNA-binding transcriptional regulator YafY